MLPRMLMLTVSVFGLAMLAMAQMQMQMMMPPPPRTITVSAAAQRQVTPDLGFAVVAVETQATTVATATAANNTTATQVLTAIRALNIPNLVARTLTFDVQPVYETPKPGSTNPPRITGYRVVNRVQARIPDADTTRLASNVGKVLDAALNAGANRVDQVTFDLQDPQRAQRDVLADATRNAHDTALAMANAAGVALGPLQTLSATPIYQPVYAMARGADLAAAPGVPITAGEMTLSANVSAVYLIQ